MSRLVGYTRRSTDHQDASPEVQERIMREYCERNGHELIRMYHEDPITGTSKVERRPVLSALLSEVKSRHRDFEGLILYRMDRLFRNRTEMGLTLRIFDKHKCEVISATEIIDRKSASGRMIAGILSEVAEYEAEVTGERIYAHNLTLALAGRWVNGRPPLGYTYDQETKRLVANDRAGDAVILFETFIDCLGNASKTARVMNGKGIPTRGGKLWDGTTVRRCIQCTTYRQRLAYDGRLSELIENIPRIVPENLTEGADHLLRHVRSFPARARAINYVYSGLLTCAECGSRYLRDGGGDYSGWACKGRSKLGICEAHGLDEKRIDAMVLEALKRTLEPFRQPIVKAAASMETKANTNAEISKKRLKARRDNVLRQHEIGVINDRELMDKIGKIDAEIKSLSIKKEAPLRFTNEQIEAWLSSINEMWPSISINNRRKLLNAMGVSIVISTMDNPYWIELRTDLGMPPVKIVEEKKRRIFAYHVRHQGV